MSPSALRAEEDLVDEQREFRFVELMGAASASSLSPELAPDLERLARLRELSTEAFLAAGRASAQGAVQRAAQGVSRTAGHAPSHAAVSSHRDPDFVRRGAPRMVNWDVRRLIVRVLAVAATVAALLLLSRSTPHGKGRNERPGGAAFAEVLTRLRRAETLQFHLCRYESADGAAREDANVWLRAPGLVRRESSPQKYSIAAGSRVWRVDESDNTVTEGASPWFLSADAQVDLLKLLEVEIGDPTALLRAKPSLRRRTAGRDELVYLATLPSRGRKVTVEALVDAIDKRL
ncbi:MAG TPA: hypothetical protein PLV92_30565, partial [Pirellulaceae bacterium]|nr:hypothetical protein [Pirellulaceae bacterium]